MSDTVVRVENLSKRYILGHQKQEGYTTLRDSITNGAKGLLKPFQRGSQVANPTSEDFWALKDVSFGRENQRC
jgi:lipopolysaccharide transport system ATP-binding protein